MSTYYEIKIKGQLDPSWSSWFEDLELCHPEEGVTALRGFISDQAALHGIFKRIRDLNLTLIEVRADTPDKSST